MKFLKASLLVLTTLFCLVSSAQAATIYTVVLDGSASLSVPAFQKENQAANALLNILYRASQLPHNIGQPADFISVGWFGGNDEYIQLPYFNVSDVTKAAVLSSVLDRIEHPKYGYTAIYTALLQGTLKALDIEKKLHSNYNQVIIVVTDGQDTQSSLEAKALARRIFPNNKFYVAIVGVGSGADISEFNFADKRIHINNFDELKNTFGIIAAFFR